MVVNSQIKILSWNREQKPISASGKEARCMVYMDVNSIRGYFPEVRFDYRISYSSAGYVLIRRQQNVDWKLGGVVNICETSKPTSSETHKAIPTPTRPDILRVTFLSGVHFLSNHHSMFINYVSIDLAESLWIFEDLKLVELRRMWESQMENKVK